MDTAPNYCGCGCGGVTTFKKGKYAKFIHNHHNRKPFFACEFPGCDKRATKRHWCDTHYRRWRVHGDVNISKKAANGSGYIQVGYAGHQVNGIRIFDHITIVEKVLGKPLPIGAVVHHVNGQRLDNRHENLVICQDRAYHNLIHARIRALHISGCADWRICRCCKQYDDIANMHASPGSSGPVVYWHKPYGSCLKERTL